MKQTLDIPLFIKASKAILDLETESEDIPWARLIWDKQKGRPCVKSKAVATIGAFDGVHIGHTMLLQEAKALAEQKDRLLIAITFSPDPSETLGLPQTSEELLSPDQRSRGLLLAGADLVVQVKFTQYMSVMSYRMFMSLVLMNFDIKDIFVGRDFRLGRGGLGTTNRLGRLGLNVGFRVHPVDLLDEAGCVVSATRIRKLIHEGKFDQANELLVRPHFAQGQVIHGRGEGTSLGFPTANISINPKRCLPDQGVYAAVVVDGKRAYPAAVNIGLPPTFDSESHLDFGFAEANLIGCHEDLYSKELTIYFLKHLRDSKKFDSLEELEACVQSNIKWVQDNVSSESWEV